MPNPTAPRPELQIPLSPEVCQYSETFPGLFRARITLDRETLDEVARSAAEHDRDIEDELVALIRLGLDHGRGVGG